MNVIRGILALSVFSPTVVLAIWSAFAHVTPETMAEYEMSVCVTVADQNSDTMHITFPLPDDHWQVAWLIISKVYISPEGQKFHNHLWGWKVDHSKSDAISKIENGVSDYNWHGDEPNYRAEIFLAKELMSRAYIYIDFPTTVDDGGYYSSINVSTFSKTDAGEC